MPYRHTHTHTVSASLSVVHNALAVRYFAVRCRCQCYHHYHNLLDGGVAFVPTIDSTSISFSTKSRRSYAAIRMNDDTVSNKAFVSLSLSLHIECVRLAPLCLVLHFWIGWVWPICNVCKHSYRASDIHFASFI